MATPFVYAPDMVPDRSLPLRSPGHVLRHDYLTPRGLTVLKLARTSGMSSARLNSMLEGRYVLTTKDALRLAAALQTTALYWLVLQARWSLERGEHAVARWSS